MNTTYEKDFNLWMENTLQQLKQKNFDAVDWTNLLEELEGLNRSDKRELNSRLTILLEHFLKLKYWETERENNARGWKGIIIEQRQQIQKILKDSPSLKAFLSEIYTECYADAKEIAAEKTGLPIDTFPIESKLSLEQVLSGSFFD